MAFFSFDFRVSSWKVGGWSVRVPGFLYSRDGGIVLQWSGNTAFVLVPVQGLCKKESKVEFGRECIHVKEWPSHFKDTKFTSSGKCTRM
jgi:hypothetical protein